MSYAKELIRQMQEEIRQESEGSSRKQAAKELTPEERERERQRQVKLELALLSRRLGERLDFDIYFGRKRVAKTGRLVTGVLIMQLNECEADKLYFGEPAPSALSRLREQAV